MEKIAPYISGLHVLPWFTDGAVDFLDGHIFYLKNKRAINPNVFEYGGGGSSLYFLSRGCSVSTVEHDMDWAERIKIVANAVYDESKLFLLHAERPYHESIFHEHANNKKFDIICIDGRDRVSCLETVVNSSSFTDAVLVLDNTERVCGEYSKYVALLKDYNLIHFETPFVFGSTRTQPETNDGLNLHKNMPSNGLAAGVYRDRSGNCNKGRSITTIATHKSITTYTTQGVPFCE